MGNNRNPRILFRCDYCGEWTSDRPSHYKRKINHFCSQACHSYFRAEILPKEAQNSFKNGGLPINEKKKRIKARSDMNHAIRQGKLFRGNCEKCGDVNAQGHHHNYDKPLEVTWLCIKCHWKEHKKIYENPELLKEP